MVRVITKRNHALNAKVNIQKNLIKNPKEKNQIREIAKTLQNVQKQGLKRIKEGSLDWEKNFKWAKKDELKVIQFLIGMSHGGIGDVIKDMKRIHLHLNHLLKIWLNRVYMKVLVEQ